MSGNKSLLEKWLDNIYEKTKEKCPLVDREDIRILSNSVEGNILLLNEIRELKELLKK